MRLLIWGNSPAGGWLAGRFHQAGHNTKWLTDAAIEHDLHRFGRLELLRPFRRMIINDLQIGSSTDELLRPPLDWIILAMPLWAVGNAVREMARRIPPQHCPPVLVFQNGIGGQEKVQNFFPDTPALQAFPTRTFQWTMLSENGGPAYETILSDGTGGVAITAGEKADDAANLLRIADVGQVIIQPKESLQWSDVLWQIQANALPTLMRVPTDQIYRQPALYQLEYQQLREAVQVIDRQQIPLVDLPGADVRRLGWQIRLLSANLLRGTLRANQKPASLQPDLVLKRGRSDAAYLNGAIAQAANTIGFPAPINHTLAVSLTDVAEGRALWHQFTPDYLSTLIRIAERHAN